MTALPLVFIALLCGIAAAVAVWGVCGLCENLAYAFRNKKAPPVEEAKEEAPRRRKERP